MRNQTMVIQTSIMFTNHHDIIISANSLCTDCPLKGGEKGVM